MHAPRSCRARYPHIVLLELVLPDTSDGLAVVRRLEAHRPAVPLVIVTGHATVPRTVEALTSGAEPLLEKPVDYGAWLARGRSRGAAALTSG